jgi:hypothetical protein
MAPQSGATLTGPEVFHPAAVSHSRTVFKGRRQSAGGERRFRRIGLHRQIRRKRGMPLRASAASVAS